MATTATETRRTKTARPVRFSAGDVAIIGFLAQARWCLAEDLAVAVGRSVAKTRQRMSALRRAGLADYDAPTGTAAWRATLPGLHAAGLGGPAARALDPGQSLHATTLASLAAAFEAAGLSYLTEYELRRDLALTKDHAERTKIAAFADERWRVPDLRVDLPDGPVAIELELNVKTRSRWASILKAHHHAGWRVLYLAPPPVERAVRRTIEERLAAASGLRIRLRAAPIRPGEAGRPQRPDPGAAADVAADLIAFATRSDPADRSADLGADDERLRPERTGPQKPVRGGSR